MQPVMANPLQQILAPRSIAVVGASRVEGKRGNLAIRYLLQNHYRGNIYPVHPTEAKILNLTCYTSIEALPEIPDLALICTPAATLPEIIRGCGRKGIAGAVVLANGFSEAGEAGVALENEMVQAARESGLRIIGPNTSGMFNTHCGANLVGYRDLRKGSIGLLTQSGNMALSLVTEGTRSDTLGFSTYIGVGNEADVQFHEYLDYFGSDPHTRVIVGYVEGLRYGRKFLESAACVSLDKPIVMYKSGRSAVGQQSARSHTGALAGSYDLARGVMRQVGVTLVDRADEILPVAATLASVSEQLPLRGDRVAILADGGGHATIAADALDSLGLSIPVLAEATESRLRALLPPGIPINNPVDVAGGTDSNPELFADCAEALLADPDVDVLLMVGLFGGYALRFSESLAESEQRCAARLAALPGKFHKPLLLQSLYQPDKTGPLIHLQQAHIPLFDSIDEATRCIAAMTHYSAAQQRLSRVDDRRQAPRSISVAALIDRALTEGRGSLYEYEALEALSAYAAEIVKPTVFRDPASLRAFAAKTPAGRHVMKLVSQDILHKTDAGGVRLNLQADTLDSAYAEILQSAHDYNPKARIEGVLLAPMAAPGVEVIIGVTRDNQYGPVLMFGLGGVFVEVLKDVAFRALPLTREDALEMFSEIRGSRILDGVRGQPAVDREALVSLVLSVSDLCVNHPEISELDLNPVVAREHDYGVLDARIILKRQEEAI